MNPRPNPERGQIALLLALFLPLLLIAAGLVVDGGRMLVEYRRARVAVDSAAYAAGLALDREAFTGADDRAGAQAVRLEPGQAWRNATTYGDRNAYGAVEITAIEVDGARVRVGATARIQSLILKLFGVGPVELRLVSRAELLYGIEEAGQ